MVGKRKKDSFVLQVLNVILSEGAVGKSKGLKADVILVKLGREPSEAGRSNVSIAVKTLRCDYHLPILNGQNPDEGYWMSYIPSDMASTVQRFVNFQRGLRETRKALDTSRELIAENEAQFEKLLEAASSQELEPI